MKEAKNNPKDLTTPVLSSSEEVPFGINNPYEPIRKVYDLEKASEDLTDLGVQLVSDSLLRRKQMEKKG